EERLGHRQSVQDAEHELPHPPVPARQVWHQTTRVQDRPAGGGEVTRESQVLSHPVGREIQHLTRSPGAFCTCARSRGYRRGTTSYRSRIAKSSGRSSDRISPGTLTPGRRVTKK